MNGSAAPSRRRLVRQSGVTSIAALVSVIAGLLLSVAIAARFGAGHRTDAWFVGSRIPLGIVALVVAAATQSLVPKFSTWFVERPAADALRGVSKVFTATVAAGLVLALVGVAVSEPLVRLTAPGLPSGTLAQAAAVSRLMFFVVPLTAAAEPLRGLLNAQYRSVAGAGMNAIMNAVAAAIVLGLSGAHIVVVAWAYLAGAAAQLLYMLVLAVRHGFLPRPGLFVRDADVRGVARLSGRPLLAASLNPVARTGEQIVVSYLPAGSISILGYGMTLVNALGGTVFFRSVIVGLLPRLTEATAHDDQELVAETTRLGLKIMLAISAPLTVYMAVLSKPAVRAVFQRGHFTGHSASVLGLLLAVYASSMIGSAMQRALLAPFFARLDTKTPLRNTFYGVAANLALLPAGVAIWGFHDVNAVLGVAIAYSAAQYVNVAHAHWRLSRTLRRPFGISWRWAAPVLAACAGSGLAMFGLSRMADLDHILGRWVLIAKTASVGALGFGVLVLLLAVLGGSGIRDLLSQGSKRGGVAHQGPRRAPARLTQPASQPPESLDQSRSGELSTVPPSS